MPRNASGTYSTPSGQPVTAGTVISSTVFNALVNDLKTEMTDSLSRSGKGGMLVPLPFGDGTVSAPGISFTNESGSGLYRAGAGDVRFALLGARALTVTASGFTVGVDKYKISSSTGELVTQGGLPCGMQILSSDQTDNSGVATQIDTFGITTMVNGNVFEVEFLGIGFSDAATGVCNVGVAVAGGGADIVMAGTVGNFTAGTLTLAAGTGASVTNVGATIISIRGMIRSTGATSSTVTMQRSVTGTATVRAGAIWRWRRVL